MAKLCLNLGCGPDYRDGYLNVDIKGGDLTLNLNDPWPWEAGSVDEILMFHVLEHIYDIDSLMVKVLHVLKPGGKFYGQVPYCWSTLAHFNHQHHHGFDTRAFEHLAAEYDMVFVKASLEAKNITKAQKIRNLIPFRNLLTHFVLNMYDVINFELRKK